EQTIRRMGSALGFTCESFINVTAGEQELRRAFVDTLSARPPRPTTADALRLITELSKALDEFSARRRFVVEFTRWASEGRLDALTKWQQHEETDLRQFSAYALREHVLAAFDHPAIIVERSPPTAETVMSLLSKGSGVAIGAYLGFHTVGDSPLFLYAAVPGGMLLCCTAAGIAEGLQFGLRERVFSWLSGSAKPPERRAPSLLRELLKEQTESDAAEGNQTKGHEGR
ncbi:MAG TPA: hypothetical protein VGI78_21950, partial [Acetobacteraceae bacterium]